MGKNQNSVVVLQIGVQFPWMIPMGVKYNHIKCERDSQVADLSFKNCSLGRNNHFWAKKAPEHIQNSQTKGNGGYTPRAA